MTETMERPAAWFGDNVPDRLNTQLDQVIARIEALKIRMLRAVVQNPFEQSEIIEELNILRASYLYLAAEARGGQRLADTSGPALPGQTAANLEIEGILGQNTIITKNLDKIARIAPTRMTVLLEGETGSGKELFARIIHLNSGLKKFVAVNCGAFPAGVIESELFGHVKGAFTGASSDRKGKFEEASGGTIFLDEIGDLELQAQVKLLRVLDAGELQRVGSDKVLKTSVRVVAATNHDLERMIGEGKFREDLYYRLSQCHLWIPPLRERRDEIEILHEYFVKGTCATYDKPLPVLGRELASFLFHTHDYPGNIRELKNISEYVVHLYAGKPLSIEDLPDRYGRIYMAPRAAADDEQADARKQARDEAEREFLVTVLARNGGDVPKTCEDMNVSRSRIYQLFKKYGVRPGDFRAGSRVLA